jgi:pimeloyl-ACP methyl ester carboxylesterase
MAKAAMRVASMAAAWLVLFHSAVEPQAPPAGVPQAALDTLVTVGDHDLHFIVHRGGMPLTILLEAGGGSDLTSWNTVPGEIARLTGATVVAYDRAGLGKSGLPRDDITPGREVRDLRLALTRLAVPTTTVLVAASYGAMLAFLHAAQPGGGVAGLVLVDPMNPRFARATGDFLASTVPELPSSPSNRDLAIAQMAASFPAFVDDIAAIEPTLPQPMIVITAGLAWWGRADIDEAWRKSHADLVAAGVQRKLLVAERSGHSISRDRPDMILSAVQQLLASLPR